MLYQLTLLTSTCSCTEWDDLRKTSRPKGPTRTDAKRAPGHQDNGEARHEGRKI
jgi:hypothetical protein